MSTEAALVGEDGGAPDRGPLRPTSTDKTVHRRAWWTSLPVGPPGQIMAYPGTVAMVMVPAKYVDGRSPTSPVLLPGQGDLVGEGSGPYATWVSSSPVPASPGPVPPGVATRPELAPPRAFSVSAALAATCCRVCALASSPSTARP